ncbi:S-adenosyl-L-methionine-dependent methyltransferase [Fomitopsis betulina]|nr:S-adenosyl-L-methionine-dependent methyltransferase [Fomitopsis betulina]
MAIEPSRGHDGSWNTSGSASSDEEIHSDTSSELIELQPDEFPRYFDERNGRLFHSHGRSDSPYPLPVDAAEQHRQNRQHALLYNLVGAHYIGPVQEVLRRGPGVQRQAVDLGTGTGKWVMDVAREFPHVRFRGIDIVPIQTRHPLPNVWFMMHDLAEPLGYASGSVDLVHARDIHLAVRDFSMLLNEAARVLRCGGLFISGEWFGYPVMRDNSRLSERAPCTYNFFALINQHLRWNNIQSVADRMPAMLRRSGSFVDVQHRDMRVPIGAWNSQLRRAGERLKTNLGVFAASMKLWLVWKGYCNNAAAEALIEGFAREVDTVQGMQLQYRITFARKA